MDTKKSYSKNFFLRKKKVKNKLLKSLLISTGTIAVGLGIFGIFLPVLPTTPFLLIAAACYGKSSDKFYYWLLHNKCFGNYIKNYLYKKGIPLPIKIYTIALLWITILLSAFLAVDITWLRIVLILTGVGVTIHILYVKTYRQEK